MSQFPMFKNTFLFSDRILEKSYLHSPTPAFEMPQTNPKEPQESCFIGVVERACQSYQGSELSAAKSFGYSGWLFERAV